MQSSTNSELTLRNSGSNLHTIYCDGGCHNTNSVGMLGIGAWAFVELIEPKPEQIKIYAGYITGGTNNIAEMMAVIMAMQFHPVGSNIDIISDSGYVVKGYNHPAYLDKWIASEWRTSTNKPVANKDLWERIRQLTFSRGVKFKLCRGHFKDPNPTHRYWNSLADKACTHMIKNGAGIISAELTLDIESGKIINMEELSWGI